jgi:3-oxoacyl-[acyl-carrier protein] reductase
MNQLDLANQVAAVTGGARGIGLAVARRMVASGAKAALWDVDLAAAEEAARALGPQACAARCDVASWDSVAAALAATKRSSGRCRSWSPMPASPGPTPRSTPIRSTPGGR